MPRPITNMSTMMPPQVVAGVSLVKRNRPTVMSTAEMIASALYVPVRVITCPARVAPTMNESIMGVSKAPELAADIPMTPWIYRGRNIMVPNKPTLSKNPTRLVVRKMGLLRNSIGMMGSLALRSTSTKINSITAENASRPMVSGLLQAY